MIGLGADLRCGWSVRPMRLVGVEPLQKTIYRVIQGGSDGDGDGDGVCVCVCI